MEVEDTVDLTFPQFKVDTGPFLSRHYLFNTTSCVTWDIHLMTIDCSFFYRRASPNRLVIVIIITTTTRILEPRVDPSLPIFVLLYLSLAIIDLAECFIL